MFKEKFNYFNNKGKKCEYPKIVKVVNWEFEAPPENLLKKVDSKFLKFIKKTQICETIERNFQEEIQKVICITPEKIFKSGIKINNDNVNYQQAELSGLNAVDARDLAKTTAATAAQKKAMELSDNDIKKAIEQYKAKQEKGETK